MNKGKLYNYIISDQNIYHAIYSMESFIFEKTLLDENDIDMYHRLTDKFDLKTIKPFIERCKYRIIEILDSNKLFPVKVYFRPKAYDPGDLSVSFRPIHTASLLDQICMVCLLNPLMFIDEDGGRKFSELVKLIPHHFFGNIPSTKLNSIFEYWPTKYKEYNEMVENRTREYIDSHEYQTEISLDIQDFFPSISPSFIYDWVVEKLSLTYSSALDVLTLKRALIKLLYFQIDIDKAWKDFYYRDKLNQDGAEKCNVLLTRGVAQGLPQGYFWGNLCMIEIASVVESVFPGDSYYYVDDSVIFSKESFDNDSFKERIQKLNDELKTLFEKKTSVLKSDVIKNAMDAESIDFLDRLSYELKFHVEDKSFYCPLSNTANDTDRLGVLHISRQVSLAGSLSDHLEEIDDVQSLDKINSLIMYIDRIINKDETSQNDNSLKSRIKFLKRYRKYFLFRKLILSFRTSSSNIEKDVDSFVETYSITEEKGLRNFFEHLEEDIFRAEYRLLLASEQSDRIRSVVEDIHTALTSSFENGEKCQQAMYFIKDMQAYSEFSMMGNVRYRSLSALLMKTFRLQLGQSRKAVIDVIRQNLNEDQWTFFPKSSYLNYVMNHSEDFKRMVLNTLVSVLLNVNVDDSLSFHSSSPRRLRFEDVRILYYLRNRYFRMADFKRFMDVIQEDTIQKQLNTLPADLSLQHVAPLFVRHVKDVEKVDQLLVTHMIVKGLWMNGSKYLYAYTLHNEEHAVELIRLCIRILRTIDCISLKLEDYFVLFLSCYLHDISMVVQPHQESFCRDDIRTDILASDFMGQVCSKIVNKTADLKDVKEWMVASFEKVYGYFENSIRSRHPYDSAEFVKNHASSYFRYLSVPIIQAVSEVSESHGWDIAEVYGRRSQAKSDLLSMKYMMILIRLADLLDMSKDRVNYFLLKENMRNLSSLSRFHWISHFITNRVELTAKYDNQGTDDNPFLPIQETIYINIYLNANFKIETSNRVDKCKWNASVNENVNLHSNYEFEHFPKIESEFGSNSDPSCSKCFFMCKWMHTKHDWLFPELQELEHYINLINRSLFTSKIKVNIIFESESGLDQDLFDSVYDFLCKKTSIN